MLRIVPVQQSAGKLRQPFYQEIVCLSGIIRGMFVRDEWLDLQAFAGNQFERDFAVGRPVPEALGIIAARPDARVRAQNGQSLLVDVSVEIDLFRFASRTGKEHHPATPAGILECVVNRSRMSRGFKDNSRAADRQIFELPGEIFLPGIERSSWELSATPVV